MPVVIGNEAEASRVAVTYLRSIHWRDSDELVVSSVDDAGHFWRIVVTTAEPVGVLGEHRTSEFFQPEQALLIEKSTGWAGYDQAGFPEPGWGSWDELSDAWRTFRQEAARFIRRPDADSILRDNAQRYTTLVPQIILGPFGWRDRAGFAGLLVDAAVCGRQDDLDDSRLLLHLLPPEVVIALVESSIDRAVAEPDDDEREYQVRALSLVCAELVLADQLDRLIELSSREPTNREIHEDLTDLRRDSRWGHRYSSWTWP